jgi:cobalt/nickel transport system permease protein
LTHLHIADGVLPVFLWAAGLLVTAALVALVSYRHRGDRADRLTLLGSLAALMLAAMAVPLGPIGHLSFAPVVGILLGPGLGFLAAVVVNAILALLGHGGITVIGLNALVLGAATATAQPLYRLARARFAPGAAAAAASVVAGVVSVLALWVVLAIAGSVPDPAHVGTAAHAAEAHDHGLSATSRFVAFASPFWAIGLAVEAIVSASVIGFLARVRPELLP